MSERRPSFASQGITLNGLTEQRQSLNMRMLFAMQTHDEAEQETLKKQLADIQEKIDSMILISKQH